MPNCDDDASRRVDASNEGRQACTCLIRLRNSGSLPKVSALPLLMLPAVFSSVLCHSVAAADVADFYKGRTISIQCGYSPGGTYDAIARLLAQHMPAHIPGHPLIVVKSMPGAGSLRAVQYLYELAPRDGTELAVVTRSYPIEPVLNAAKTKYSATRFEPIGSTSPEISVGVTWHTSRIKTLDDLLRHGAIVGSSSLTDDTGRYPLIIKNLTQAANMKIVVGYPGGNEITAAVERGEVDARVGWSWGSIKSRSRSWLAEKKINIFVQLGMDKAADLPNVPFIMDYARNETDKSALELLFAPMAAAWPLIAPPDVPNDRIAALRQAFQKTMKDPAFRAAAATSAIEIQPMGGSEMAQINQRIGATSPAAVERAKALASSN